MSSAIERLPCSGSGTLSSIIIRASPSTTAVLPTPGSPIRTGLFLVRRISTSIRRGDLLIAPDDRVELALPSQLGQVDAVLLERLEAASRRRDRPPCGHLGRRRTPPPAGRGPGRTTRTSGSAGSVGSAIVARSRCSVPTYWSPRRSASSWARWNAALTRLVMYKELPFKVAGRAARSRWRRSRIGAGETPRCLNASGTRPSRWPSRISRRCSLSSALWRSLRSKLLRAAERLSGLLGELFNGDHRLSASRNGATPGLGSAEASPET